VTACLICAAEFDGTTDYLGVPLRGGSRRNYCSRRCRQDARNTLSAACRSRRRSPRGPRPVDDIAIERACRGDRTVHLTRPEMAVAMARLYALKLPASAIAKRLGVTMRTAERHRPKRVPVEPPARKVQPVTPTTGWSANRLTARAVALYARDTADALLLLEALGLIDGPDGRVILPDDTRNYDVEGTAPDSGSTIGWRKVVPEPPADRANVPVGLREGAA